MSESIERAQEGIEKAHESHEQGNRDARRVAVLISVLAALLAIAEMQEKASQNAYLTHHIEVSDDFAFYQAKNVRSNLYTLHAEALSLRPDATDPKVASAIQDARATAARLEDDEKTRGRKQLYEQAHEHQREREESFRRYERFELVVGGLQIAIVLASVSVVTRVRLLALTALGLGLVATAAGAAVAIGI